MFITLSNQRLSKFDKEELQRRKQKRLEKMKQTGKKFYHNIKFYN